MTELVPYATYNERQNIAADDRVHYPDSWLTQPARDLVVRYVDVVLEFIGHTSLAEDRLAVRQIIEARDPRSTVILFEGISASAVIAGDASTPGTPSDAFDFGETLARERGFQVFGADMTRRQWQSWQQLQRTAGAEKLPNRNDLTYDLFTSGFRTLDFFEAAASYLASLRDTNSRQNSQTILRESALHYERERIAANTTKTLAVKIARWHHANNILDKTAILLFYAPSHQEPIEGRLRQFGIPYRSTNHSGKMRWEAMSKADMVTGITAYEFAKQFFFYHLRRAPDEPTNMQDMLRQQRNVWTQVDACSIADLRDIYEIFRNHIANQTMPRRANELAALVHSYPRAREFGVAGS